MSRPLPDGGQDMSSDRSKSSRSASELPLPKASQSSRVRPAKPYAGFPLFPHATGRWAKKIRGKFVFFGPWSDPFGALERYTSQRDALHAGLVARAVAGAAEAVASTAGSATARSRPTFAPNASPTGRANAGTRRSANGSASASKRSSPTTGISGVVRDATEALTLRDLVNRFLTAKQRRLDGGEMSPRSFNDYFHTASLFLSGLGKDRRADDITPADFGMLRTHLAKGRGPVSLGAHIQRIRCMFKFAFDGGLMDRPVRFGPEFEKPSRKAVRQARNERPDRMFEPAEIKTLLASAGVQMRAMILLGLNAGLGNTDLSSLPRSALDLKRGFVDFPRPKTQIPRRAPLWPETVDALRQALEFRPKPKEPGTEDLVFVTKYGRAWVRNTAPGPRSKGKAPTIAVDSIGLEFGKIARQTGLAKPGRSFYAMRHTFRTIADEVRDRPAIDMIMGHQDGNDIATAYIERISDERLRKVVEHVRGWLNPST